MFLIPKETKIAEITKEQQEIIHSVIKNEKIDTEDLKIYFHKSKTKLIDKYGICVRVIDIQTNAIIQVMYDDLKKFNNSKIEAFNNNTLISDNIKKEAIITFEDYDFNSISGASISIEEARNLIAEEKVNKINSWESSKVYYCVISNDYEMLEKILEKNPELINGDSRFKNTNNDDTPLMRSMRAGLEQIAKVLLKYPNIDLNFQNNSSNNTALHELGFHLQKQSGEHKLNLELVKMLLSFKGTQKLANTKNRHEKNIYDIIKDERIIKAFKKDFVFSKDFKPVEKTNKQLLQNRIKLEEKSIKEKELFNKISELLNEDIENYDKIEKALEKLRHKDNKKIKTNNI